MSLINSALSALSAEDSDALEQILEKLSKEEIQEVAKTCQIKSATFLMRGSWTERTSGKLLSPDGDIVESNIFIDRAFKGGLEQYYGMNSLHLAALVALIASDFDEDSFSAGDMLFGENYGYPADGVEFDADCKSEHRYTKYGDIDYGEFEEDECEVDDNNSEMTLTDTYILPNHIELLLKDGKKIRLPIYEASDKVQWFIFSALFMASKKSLDDIDKNVSIISDFLRDRFEIDVGD